MERPFFGLVRSKQNVCFSIVILFLFFQIVPLAVRNVTASVMPRIAAGGLHSIAMKTTGTVWTWGNNMYGQLGDGTATDSNVPVYVSGLSDAISVAGGFWHTAALKSDGTVWTWGNNFYGQLGNGTNTDSSIPVQVSGLSDVIAIASGYWHTVVLKKDGSVWTWGNNFYGQLGNGTNTDSKTPVQVSGLSGVIAIASGYWHTIALKPDGTVRTWGNNTYGQLGNGTNISSATPVQVNSLTNVDTNVDNVTSITGGYWHSLALKTEGTAVAWGNNFYGQLGDGSNIDRHVPVPEATVNRNLLAIAGGGGHTLCLRSDGTVWTCGRNYYGQLGTGNYSDSNVLKMVNGLGGIITSIASGYWHSIALCSDGTVWTWGGNYNGQLGNGENGNSNIPVLARLSQFDSRNCYFWACISL
ncbi:MAG: RCC1 repeat- and reductase domain-containing protein [Planctomycetes bacterium]|nr:RCC1 repeat- and reductase domain-containing protein [Planctomycetota bacterium]